MKKELTLDQKIDKVAADKNIQKAIFTALFNGCSRSNDIWDCINASKLNDEVKFICFGEGDGSDGLYSNWSVAEKLIDVVENKIYKKI